MNISGNLKTAATDIFHETGMQNIETFLLGKVE